MMSFGVVRGESDESEYRLNRRGASGDAGSESAGLPVAFVSLRPVGGLSRAGSSAVSSAMPRETMRVALRANVSKEDPQSQNPPR